MHRTPRPGDLLAVRSSDPYAPETQVVLDRVVDNGATLLMAGRWGAVDLEVLVRRVGATNPQE